ncbi:MAG: HAMP domain-containing sensor histidine kinase, partial [Actinomycetota bacterium]
MPRGRFHITVRLKLYGLGIPLAILAFALVVTQITTYNTTHRRILEARTAIIGSLAAQRLERESDQAIWHLSRLVATGDRSIMKDVAGSRDAATDAFITWAANTDSPTSKKHLEHLAAIGREIEEEVDLVMVAVEDGRLAIADKLFFDNAMETYDDRYDDDLDRAVADEVVAIRDAFIELGSDSGRLEGIFVGRLTSLVDETSGDVARVQGGAEFLESLTGAALEMATHVARGHPSHDELQDEHTDGIRVLTTWKGTFEGRPDERNEQRSIEAIDAQFADIIKAQERLLEEADSPDHHSDTELALGHYNRDLTAIIDATEKMIRVDEADITAMTAQVASDARRLNMVTTAIFAGLFLAGALFVIPLARVMSRRVTELSAAARQVEAGDLTASVTPTSSDEIAQLGHAFNEMVHSLREAKARSDLLNDRQREFAMLSQHELRTPLTVLLVSIESMIGASEEERRELEVFALRGGRRLRRLTENLEIAGSTRSLMASRMPTELLRTIEDAVEDLEATDRVVVDVPFGITIFADDLRLQQVFANLLENALEKTPTSDTVSISATSRDGYVTVIVSDRGPGFDGDAPDLSPGSKDERCVPFSLRPDAARGLGLGLWVTCELVTAMGGELHAKNNAPERGATIAIHLPIAADH